MKNRKLFIHLQKVSYYLKNYLTFLNLFFYYVIKLDNLRTNKQA